MTPRNGSTLPSEDTLKGALQQLRGHLEVPALGAVVVSQDGAVRVAVSGERATGSGEAVQRNDPWHLGSNAKAMTALLVARLVQNGEVSWDDRMVPVLRDRVKAMAEGWDEVTFRHLLTHCGGPPPNASTLTMIGLVGGDSRDAVADRLRHASDVLGDPPRTDHNLSWFGLGGLRAKAPNFGADNPPALGPAERVHMSLSDYATFLLDQLRGPEEREGFCRQRSTGACRDPAAIRRWPTGEGSVRTVLSSTPDPTGCGTRRRPSGPMKVRPWRSSPTTGG